MITFNIWLIPMTMAWTGIKRGTSTAGTGIITSTTRTTWMANNAIPDSIIMKMMCRNSLPLVEPKVCSIDVGLITLVTLRILNTIMPVTTGKVFTAMDVVKPVKNNAFGQLVISLLLFP